jgi:drug/metabolite transporter (DMT)-like permease
MIAVSAIGSIPSLSLSLLYVNKVPAYFKEYMIVAIPMAWIGFFSSVCFNKSLQYTLQSTTNVVNSTTAVFTLFFELILLNEPFSTLPFLAGLMSLVGCALVANDIPASAPLGPSQVYHHDLGIFLALLSALTSALFSVLVRVYRISDTMFFLPCMAFVTFFFSPLVLSVTDVMAIENFSFPSGVVFLWIMGNGTLSLASNFWQMRSINILSPFIVNMFLCMSIPLSIICDCFIRKISVTWQFGIGTVIVVASSVAVAGIPRKKRDEEGGSVSGGESEPLTAASGASAQ